MAEPPEPSYTEALVEARRGFDHLASEVDTIRGRAVALLGAGGLAASFIGGFAIHADASVSGWTWTAVGSFVVMALLAVAVLLPHRFHVSLDPATIVTWAEDSHQPATERDIERDLALWLGRKYDENRPKVDRLGTACAGVAALFLVEVAALVLDLMTR